MTTSSISQRNDPIRVVSLARLMLSLSQCLIAVLMAVALAGCGTAPTHPQLRAAQQSDSLAPLIPMRRFVANVDRFGGFVLSPNGQRLVWQQAVGLDVGLAVRDVAAPERVSTFAVGNQGRGGGLYSWLGNNQHLVYSKDPIGDENIQLWVQDANAPLAPWLATPWRGSRSIYLGRGAAGSGRFWFANNQRDKSTFDLYEADAQTRQVREVARSDGTVVAWVIGQDRQLAARVRKLSPADDAETRIEWLTKDGAWLLLQSVSSFDSYLVPRIDAQAGKAWVLSNVGRDKLALLEVSLQTGQERVLAEHAEVDLSYAVFANAQADGQAQAPIGYVAEPGLPQMTYLDEALSRDVQAAVQKALAQGAIAEPPVLARPSGFSENNQRVLLRTQGHFESAELLLDRSTGAVQRLNSVHEEAAEQLAKMEPFAFNAADGRRIHGYVIRPRGVTGPAPLVLNIHGGPTARDHWSPAGYSFLHMLANRGYAVMVVNYRGSSGYGKEHTWAGAREYWGRMQQDMAQAVQWAIDQGIADRERLGVMGGSFGGFSTLAQLIQKPHNYRCGVNVVGVANWPRAIESFPPYWRLNRPYLNRMYGDMNDPAARAVALANSPISHIDKIEVPLLVIHGANDVRVIKQDSDDVVAALQKLGRPVQYMVFNDEGHSISKWRNRLAMSRAIEDHFAACLGGRSNGFDWFEMMPR
jgi:dipeptidyl aminopeptidase/acylaminoacyl peptidase